MAAHSPFLSVRLFFVIKNNIPNFAFSRLTSVKYHEVGRGTERFTEDAVKNVFVENEKEIKNVLQMK